MPILGASAKRDCGLRLFGNVDFAVDAPFQCRSVEVKERYAVIKAASVMVVAD